MALSRLGRTLIVAGVIAVLVPVVAPPVSPSPTYITHVEAVDDATAPPGTPYTDADVQQIESLSADGQRVFRDALSNTNGTTVVQDRSRLPSDFTYVSEEPTLGNGAYIVEHRGTEYGVVTRAAVASSGVWTQALLVAEQLLTPLGVVVLVIGGSMLWYDRRLGTS
jgi:hypothetical protein